MRATIESRDGHFRAEVVLLGEGGDLERVEVTLWRYAGWVDDGHATPRWSRQERQTYDKPFGRVCECVHAWVWPMTDRRK